MAAKQTILPGIGPVTLYKRRDSRSIRLSLARDGSLRVSLPYWVPYKAGLDFARTKRDWIVAQQHGSGIVLSNQQAVGKAHHLYLWPENTMRAARARIKNNEIIVSFPADMAAYSMPVQDIARRACIRALRQEAEELLPKRLHDLAQRHGLQFHSVSIRQLASRWGSCNQHQDITLSLFLMQLPWQLIDYVLLHELVHTKVLRHGPDFWAEFESHLPSARALRREMRNHRPILE